MKPTPALLAKIAQQVKAATAAASAPALPPPPPPAPEQPAKPKATRIPAGHTRHPTDPTACLDAHLRADRTLPPDTAKALVTMIQLAYKDITDGALDSEDDA